MPPLRILPVAAALLAFAALPPAALAAVPHTVVAGETLWSIAAASNLTTRALAAYNGMDAEGHVVLGSTILVPSEAEAAAALQGAGAAPAGSSPATGTRAPAPMGAYTVRSGDTLSGLAATAGVPLEHVAAMNGLDPAAPLPAGTVLKLPSGSPVPSNADAPEPEQTVVPAASPRPTGERVDAGQIGQIASAHGVPGSLAAAIAWQESGFNNAAVSAANARGVMQIMPGTWSWIEANLAAGPLDSASALDNVHAGAMYLGRLLKETGDEATAIAAYYQGLGSLRSRGPFDDTRRYVANVQALRARFGG